MTISLSFEALFGEVRIMDDIVLREVPAFELDKVSVIKAVSGERHG